MNLPIITLEVEAMKHTMKTALSQYAAQIDTEIQAAVDEFCTPENIKRVVQEAAKSAIAASIKGSVHSYFTYGKGREQVAEAVREQLELKTETETPKVGDIVEYYGSHYTILNNGETANTFDLVAHPNATTGDRWRNVPASKVHAVKR